MISSCWKIKQTLYSTPCFTADALFYYYLFRNENHFVEQGSEFSDEDTPFDGIAQVDRHVSYTKSL